MAAPIFATLLNPVLIPPEIDACAVWQLSSAAGQNNFMAASVVAWVVTDQGTARPVIVDMAGTPRTLDFNAIDPTLRCVGTVRECKEWMMSRFATFGVTGELKVIYR